MGGRGREKELKKERREEGVKERKEKGEVIGEDSSIF